MQFVLPPDRRDEIADSFRQSSVAPDVRSPILPTSVRRQRECGCQTEIVATGLWQQRSCQRQAVQSAARSRAYRALAISVPLQGLFAVRKISGYDVTIGDGIEKAGERLNLAAAHADSMTCPTSTHHGTARFFAT